MATWDPPSTALQSVMQLLSVVLSLQPKPLPSAGSLHSAPHSAESHPKEESILGASGARCKSVNAKWLGYLSTPLRGAQRYGACRSDSILGSRSPLYFIPSERQQECAWSD